MTEKHSPSGPYEFTKHDLAPGVLEVGATATLSHYYDWQAANTALIADHISLHTEQLEGAVDAQQFFARLRRQFNPSEKRRFQEIQLAHDIGFFCLYNAAEVPDDEAVKLFSHSMGGGMLDFAKAKRLMNGGGGIPKIGEVMGRQIPVLSGQPELKWLDEQLARLQRILPESVIQGGGLGKAARTTAGVLALGLYDVLGESASAQREHLASIIPAGYAYGAMYPIIDDALQDTNAVGRDKERYHEAILRCLRSGTPIDPTEMVDHPLAEELENIYNILLDSIPFAQNRHFYHAGESMYLAQHRDSQLTVEHVAAGGIKAIYRDIFIKSSMTRVVANIIARRDLGADYYARAININFINQFTDDLQDRHEDSDAGRLTPFTAPSEAHDTNPLYDLFGYGAYVVDQLFGSDPQTLHTLTNSHARRLVGHLRADPHEGRDLIDAYGATDEIVRFIRAAADLPRGIVRKLKYPDMKLEQVVSNISKERGRSHVDPRVFVSDELDYINGIVLSQGESTGENPIDNVTRYALEAGGKRLRPALTLMLAESLSIDRKTLAPLLKAVEWFHTSSLIFDDLPAQDGAQLRRGRPTPHVAFGEARAQLAGIAMISGGFGVLSKLTEHYPAERVTKLIDYFGTILGPERLCLGQDMDLNMGKGAPYTTEDIIEMYSLKTSAPIEASLVPIMLLEGRPDEEVELVKTYAHHAGIVYQLRDDILDATSKSDILGKDANNDISKVNIVRVSSIEEARQLMEQHLDAARQYCARLPFNTNLLANVVTYFANRKA